MSIPAGNGATGAPGTGPVLWYILNLFWFNSLFMLISENNMNTCTYLTNTLSLIYIIKLLVIFGIKIYRKLPIILTEELPGSGLFLPRAVAEEGGWESELVLCCGYRPMLVSPGSIVGAPPRQRSAGGVLAAMRPLLERDMNAGRERTLNAVCFMNLLYIMTRLPDNAEDVIQEVGWGSLLPFSLR
jgi:hypothetical protein